jgi:hypothetical protein
MSANSVLSVSSVNFDELKSSLKTFLKSQNQFTDYDFESSTISILLDLLAYNTYHNSFYLNMIGNESFLDSAQLRNSVVSRAKGLGYTPRSARGATASLDVVVTPDDSPTSVSVAANTVFTTVNNVNYTFVTPEVYNLENSGSNWVGTITIKEGDPIQQRWTVDTANPVRYIIPNRNADTTSFNVRVQESSSNTTITTYQKNSDITRVQANSNVYFVQENEDNKYEIYFGDNVFGKRPINGNIVILEYRIVNGSAVNGVTSFSGPAALDGYGTYSFTVSANSSGGANTETIESIKYIAPKTFEAQNRIVTAEDVKVRILSQNGDIQAINVWGGEDNVPPQYGKVYISVKPRNSTIISDQRKEAIISDLSTQKILTLDPVIVDATFLFIVPTVKVKYDPSTTSLSAAAIIEKIKTSIINFETNTLGVFGNKFYYSDFIAAIDASDTSIISVLADLELQKRFVPITSSATQYNLSYSNPIKNPYNGYKYAVSESTAFTYLNRGSSYFDDDGLGKLRVYYSQGSNRIYTTRDAGSVDYASGLVTINNLQITDYIGDEVKVNVEPREYDISAIRNQLLLITDLDLELINSKTGNRVASLSNIDTQGQSATLLQSQISNVIL